MSATKPTWLLLLGALGLFAVVMIFAPLPQKKRFVPTMLFANPLFYKASSGYFHTLLADRLWLQSNSIGEVARNDTTDDESFAHAFKTIAIMDPHFFLAANYGALYLASIRNRSDLAIEIIDTALSLYPKNFDLMMMKLAITVSYVTPRNFDKIRELAQQTIRLGIYRNKLKEELATEYVQTILISAAEQTNRKQEIYQDLIWLYKSTTNPERKEKIKTKIEELFGNPIQETP